MKKKLFSSVLIITLISLMLLSTVFADESIIYNNWRYGFSFDYNDFSLDDSNETIKTTFYNDTTKVDIFYDDFSDSIHNSKAYYNYSNLAMEQGDYVDVLFQKREQFDEYDAYITSWYRRDLKYLSDYYNYYLTIDIIKSDNQVYTLYIKSKNVINYQEMLERFKLIDIDESAPLNYKQYNRAVNPYWSETTRNFYYDDFCKKDYVDFGYFDPNSKDGLTQMELFEQSIDHKIKYMLEYYDMSINVTPNHFQQLNAEGKVLEFTYQTSYFSKFNRDMLYRILDGKEDESIEKLAETLKSIGEPVLFRFDNEMNGDWCDYNALHYQRDTEIFVKTWQYMHDKIIATGADNVIFVFNPNEASFPDFKWNHYTNYFPGTGYVDVIGVTGYNTGDYYVGETWRTFPEIYDKVMADYQERFPSYAFYITEFGSNIFGGDRDAWFAEMLNTINDYDLKVAIYWSGIDWDKDNKPARIYRIDGFNDITKQLKNYYKEQEEIVKAKLEAEKETSKNEYAEVIDYIKIEE